MPTPRRVAIGLGSGDDGTPAVLRPDGGNVLVSGDPRSGKSWVAGLAAEYLMDAGYRVCVFDPESDHAAVGRRPGAIVLGREIALPSGDDLGTVIADAGVSVAVDMAALPYAKKREYVGRALASICAERARSGIPHSIIVDEAHHFFGADPVSSADAGIQTGNILLVTHRPSLIAARVLESIGAFVLTQTTVEQERYFVDTLLRARGPGDLDVSTALHALESARGGLLSRDGGGPRWQTFVSRPRLSAQAIHTRRSADIAFSAEKGFFFRLPGDGTVAAARTLEEFDRALASIPSTSLQYHVLRGDFSRWVRDVLGDAALAAGLGKLEAIGRTGAPVEREELRRHLHARYVF